MKTDFTLISTCGEHAGVDATMISAVAVSLIDTGIDQVTFAVDRGTHRSHLTWDCPVALPQMGLEIGLSTLWLLLYSIWPEGWRQAGYRPSVEADPRTLVTYQPSDIGNGAFDLFSLGGRYLCPAQITQQQLAASIDCVSLTVAEFR